MAQSQEKAEQAFEQVSGVRQENLNEIHKMVKDQYDRLLRDYVANTSAALSQLMHVAQLLVNRKLLQEAYTRINSGVVSATDIGQSKMQQLERLSSQIKSMTGEINAILKDFKKADDL